MSLDGRLLARAKKKLDARRAQNERELAGRRAEAYLRAPVLREIEAGMRSAVTEAIAAALTKGKDPVAAVEKIRDRSLELQAERARTLASVKLPPDWLTEKYYCEKCHDTGYVGSELCTCLRELYKDEQRAELSKLLDLGGQSFSTFRLDYYDAAPAPGESVSPRRIMGAVLDFCRDYAEKFTVSSPSLYFTGGTGLGKTFMSAAIARVVSERGYSVFYDTATSVFLKYEQEKFSRSAEELEAARADIRRMEKCDLLIIDDLGTEMTTQMVVSALYTVINNRLMARRPTIISSNLPTEALTARYSPAIASRIEGEFVKVGFVGKDVRKIRA